MIQPTPGITPDSRPVRNSEIRWRSVGRDVLLVHGLLKQYHVLNTVAARIWELATGEHTAAQIADILSTEYRHDNTIVYQDVVETLEGLSAIQLLSLQDRT